MGSWETTFRCDDPDLVGRKVWICSVLTLSDGRGHVGGHADEYLAAMHPDDRHLVAAIPHHLADRQDSFPAEYRIVRPDGTVLWLSGRGLVVEREPDGRPRRLVSVMADVTEARRRGRHAAPGARAAWDWR